MKTSRVSFVCGSIALIATALSWGYNTGTFRLFSDLQMSLLVGRQSRFLSLALSVVVIQIACERTYCLWKHRRGTGDESCEPSLREPRMLDKLTNQSSRFYLFAGTSIAFGAISVCLLIPTLWSSKLELVKVADLEKGTLPSSNWVMIDDGKLLWNDSFQMIERFSRKYVVPVVSSQWQPGQPVAVFAVMPVEDGDEMGDYETIQGVCRLTGLDNQVEEQIAGHVEFEAADRHIMVQHGTDPGMDRNLGLVLCGVCFLTAVAAIFLYTDNPEPKHEPVIVTHEVKSESEPEAETALADAVVAEAVPADSATNPEEVANWLRDRGIQYEDSNA
jgi:hypothetical protein